MIHPEDYDALERMFRSENIPDDLVAEYEVQRLMASAYGHVGSLGMNLVIPLMRALGYGKVVEKAIVNVDWRNHVGSQVVAQYGDQKLIGKVLGFGSNSRLVLDLPGHGEVELPRYCVQLIPVRELDVEKPVELKSDPWATVSRGTKIIVRNGEADFSRGQFLGVADGGLRIKIGQKERTVPPSTVELAP